MEKQDRKTRIVPESDRTKKVREKLRQQYQETESLITEAALADTVNKIHEWISANAMHRIVLRKKEICLFDQNQNAAHLSRKVEEIAKQIRVQFENLSLKREDSPSVIKDGESPSVALR